MRQTHLGGDKLFVDYAGDTVPVIDRLTGEAREAQQVVEVRPGAGSSIAAEYVARSPADGYTLFMASLSNVTNAVTNSNLPFDFVKDFAPVASLAGLPLILAVHPSLGLSSVDALIALARARPGELTYGSVGPGTVGHLAMELISARKNIKLVHVPYPGSPPHSPRCIPASTLHPLIARAPILEIASLAF
jgi:tripartite-type tricarboxylate transporter receptor subunit TctC